MLAYLLSKPDGWQVRSEDILNHGTEGRDAVRSAMQELKLYGYARLDQTPGGREWVIIEEPCPEKPFMEPCPEKANIGKTAPSKNKRKESKNNSSSIQSKMTDDAFWVEVAKTYDYLDMEEQKKKMAGWLLTNPRRQLTRRFVINWLNRQDKPIKLNGNHAHQKSSPKSAANNNLNAAAASQY